MKYDFGDLVLVRNNLKVGQWYGDNMFSDSMEEFRGRIVKIEGFSLYSQQYRIQGSMHFWTDEMLQDIHIDKFQEFLGI